MDLLNSDLTSYWNDILKNSKLIGNLKDVEKIEDKEEKLFSMLMRVVFLSIMGLKKENDEAKTKYKDLLNNFKLIESYNGCNLNCKIKQKLSNYLENIDEIKHTDLETNDIFINEIIQKDSNESLHDDQLPKSDKERKILAPETQYNNAINNEFCQKVCIIPETIDYNEINVSEIDQENADISSPSLLGKMKNKETHNISSCEWLQPILPKTKLLNKSCNKKRFLLSEEIDSSGVKNCSKKLKQTIISRNSFLKNISMKAATDGAKLLKAISSVDEDEKVRLKQAIEESLATHECEVIMRKKRKEIQKNKSPKIITMRQRKSLRSQFEKKDKSSTVEIVVKDEMQLVSRNLFKDDSIESDIYGKSPLKLNRKSPQKTSRIFCSPKKLQSPTKCSTPHLSGIQPSTSRKISEYNVLNQLEKSLPDFQKSKIPSPDFQKSKKPSQDFQKCKKPLPEIINFQDSFDYVAKSSPRFANFTVRKQCERKALRGWSCLECKDYYESRNLNEDEKKEAMNRCSRHRSKHNVLNNTPNNFWNPEWTE